MWIRREKAPQGIVNVLLKTQFWLYRAIFWRVCITNGYQHLYEISECILWKYNILQTSKDSISKRINIAMCNIAKKE
jgi:hypothetical protein